MKTLYKFLSLLLFILCSVALQAQTIRYVKEGGAGTADGSSWENASADLHSMIDSATDGQQVWVAAGSYYPVPGSSFNLKSGIEIYGGFAASGAPGMGSRDFNANQTVLGGIANSVVTGTGIQSGTLDGFTISGGNGYVGGGISLFSSGLSLKNLVIKNNTAVQGGGIFMGGCTSYLNNILVELNVASSSGGGISILASSGQVLENIIVRSNLSEFGMGGLFIYNSSPHFKNMLVTGNTGYHSGAMQFTSANGARLTNVTLVNNNTSDGMDTVFETTDTFAVENSILTGSFNFVNSTPSYTNSLISGSGGSANWNTAYGTNLGNNIDAAPAFTDPGTGNFGLQATSPAIDAGNATLYTGLTTATKDLAGNPRVDGATIDMGAFEFVVPLNPNIKYVKQGGSGTADGSSWANASGNLQAMINAATNGQEVWVAAGTYQQPYSTSFMLKTGVGIYGGFPNSGNPAMADRDFNAHQTVLLGTNVSVVRGTFGLSSCVFDGFKITGGIIEGLGGMGGGLNISGTTYTLQNLIVTGNSAMYGGGISLLGGNPTVKNVVISNNSSSTLAGGIYMSNVRGNFENIIVRDNYSEDIGGGIYVSSGSPHFKNMLVTGNSAYRTGGMGFAFANGTRLTNVTIANNSTSNGADIASDQTTFSVENSIMTGTFEFYYSTPSFAYSLISGSGGSSNWNTSYGYNLGNNIDAAPAFTDPGGGNFGLQPTSPAVDAGNAALYTGLTAATKDLAGNPRVDGANIDMGAYEAVALPNPNIKYVKQGGAGSADGSSWANASGDVQAMIDAATDGQEVWVAAGTYQPAAGTAYNLKTGVKIYGGFPASGNPGMFFRDYTANVTTLQGNNNTVVQASALTGTLLDGFTVTGGTSNVGGGLVIAGSTITLENLIVNNNIGVNGGGIYILTSNSILKKIVVDGNYASSEGGGIYIQNSTGYTTYLENVVVKNNSAEYSGGGIRGQNPRLTAVNLLVYGNTANNVNSAMTLSPAPQVHLTNATIIGGVQLSSPNGARFKNSIFTGPFNGSNSLSGFQNSIIVGSGGSANWNTAYGADNGGNIDADPLFVDPANGDYSLQGSSPAINAGNNALYTDLNQDTKDLAGNPRVNANQIDMGAYESAYPVILNIRYVRQGGTGNGASWEFASGNLAQMMNESQPGQEVWVAAGTYQPAALSSFIIKQDVKVYGGFPATGSPLMANRDINANETILAGNNGTVVRANTITGGILDGFTITGGVGTDGGGIGVFSSSVIFENLIIKNNSATSGGGIYITGGASSFKNIALLQNSVTQQGGGMYAYSSTQNMENIIVKGNTSGFNGGGLAFYESNPQVKNMLITGNTAQYAGAITLSGSTSAKFINVTSSGNTSTVDSDHYFANLSASQFVNSIITGSVFNGNGTIEFIASLVAGSGGSENWNTAYGTNGGKNIDGDPLFVDPAAGDYSLQGASPAIDAGNNTLYTGLDIEDNDLDGNDRVYSNGIIDMGAYEYQGIADCAITTTWSGGSWSNGAPVSNGYAAVIADDYGSSGNLTACSLTINSGAVTVNSGDNFIIKGAVTVQGGSLTFNNNTNLVQQDDVANTGSITYKRESNPLQYLDYTLWSSPTSGTQVLKDFSTQTLDASFYVYNPGLGAWSNHTSASGIFGGTPQTVTFTQGKGYLIRMPSGLAASGTTVFEGVFTGVPNNGDVAIAAPAGFNAIGNPYPSPINIHNFIDDNAGVLDNDGTLYFWRKTNNAATTTYATINKIAYVKNEAAGGDTGTGYFNVGDEANWTINSGQGFLVKSLGGSVSFDNSMRRSVNTGQFFRTANSITGQEDISRYWLTIAAGNAGFGEMAVAYTGLATTGLDYGYDGRFVNDGALAIYSLAGATKLAIQARPSFVNNDVVPLGYKATTAGSYSIALAQTDGLFANGQAVYLKDNTNGTVHNISQSAYAFETLPGTFTNRFEVIYSNGALGTGDTVLAGNNVMVYKQGNELYIESENLNIDEITIYDTRGRLLYQSKNINALKSIINSLNVQQQVLIMTIGLQEGKTVTKKIIY